MYEIEPSAFGKINLLFPNLDMHLAVKALLAGNVSGKVYGDEPVQPQSVIARIGELFYLGGSPDNDSFNSQLTRFFSGSVYPDGNAEGAGHFIIKCTVNGWAQKMDVLLPDRYPISKYQHYYASQGVRQDWRGLLPPEITFRLVDRALLTEDLEGLDDLIDEMCSERPSVEEFLHKSFGYVPIHGKKVIGWCLSEYNCGDRCEIGIATAVGYQRRGLATLITAAFSEYARTRGITHIGWHCDSENEASIATALKAGFTKQLEYPVFLCFRNQTIHLIVRGDYCFRRKQYSDAAALYERAIQQDDAPDEVYLDSACAHAMSGLSDQAFHRLHEAVEHGFNDLDYLQTCPWLDSLRGTAAWSGVMQKVEALSEEQDD